MKKPVLATVIVLCILPRTALCLLAGYWLLLRSMYHPPMSEVDMARRYVIAREAIAAIDPASCDITVSEHDDIRFERRSSYILLPDGRPR